MNFNYLIKTFLFIILFLHALPVTYADAVHRVMLEVEIDVDRSHIKGVWRMDVAAGEDVVLMIGALSIEDVTFNGRPVDYEEFEQTIKIVPRSDGEISIRYNGIFRDRGASQDSEDPRVENVIDERGVSLTNIWYPTHGELAFHDLKAVLPSGFKALSEAEDITEVIKEGKVHYHFRFPYEVAGINLVASDRYEIISDSIRDIEIYAYFFPEDVHLAKSYIAYTKKYLEMYEDLLGMYPFKRFSIVENFLPTGYSMPGFTLLGSTVVKLPFIVETSLGHEIVHQWFGNYVYIDYDSGNWAEGLTTYLADHLYREQQGEGWQYRKQILVDYRSYVSIEREVPLKFFTGRVDRPSRSLGYGKGAMVFHMLKNMVGRNVFYASLKDFIQNNRFKRASWNDIKVSFEDRERPSLDWFFTQWVEKEGLPELTLYGAELTQEGKNFNLHFHVDLEGDVYRLSLPVTIYFKDKILFDSLTIDGSENSFDLPLRYKPDRIVLDEDYDIARGIGREEFPPVVARLLEEDTVIIAVPAGGEEMYENIIDEFERKGAVSKTVQDIKFSDIEEHSLIILGSGNPLTGRLYGSIAAEDAGFSLIMKENPWNPLRVVALIHGTSRDEIDAAYRKISHYGKYSMLLFDKGINRRKEIQGTKRGVVMDLHHEATAIEVSSIRTLTDVVRGVNNKKIIYVGEVHDVFAHHAVQLDIITGIYKRNPRVAIGMEMFQRPFQKTLDSFIAGKTGEVDFLKQSEYFNRWGFDYHLYKPILDFARTEKIPVIALNLQREIIEKVSHGGIDSLSDEEKALIPQELDFSDDEYRERLKEVFSMHEGADEKNFHYFYQSQILWDETMSHSVDEFLKKNPDNTIVVLAGQGHLRYGSGIPKRTFRRNAQDYAIVLIDEEVEKDIADYVVFPKPVEGITTPKLMVFLSKEEGRMKIAGFPEKSVSEKAGMKVDDIILFIDETEIKSIDDIKIYLLGKKRGDFVKVKIRRKEDDLRKEMVFDVEL